MVIRGLFPATNSRREASSFRSSAEDYRTSGFYRFQFEIIQYFIKWSLCEYAIKSKGAELWSYRIVEIRYFFKLEKVVNRPPRFLILYVNKKIDTNYRIEQILSFKYRKP